MKRQDIILDAPTSTVIKSSDLVDHLTEMLCDLESNPLVVVLAPSRRHDRNEMDQIRVVVSRNPSWYRSLCGANISKRGTRHGKFDTAIRRQNILRILTRLSEGKPTRSKYAPELIKIANKL